MNDKVQHIKNLQDAAKAVLGGKCTALKLIMKKNRGLK